MKLPVLSYNIRYDTPDDGMNAWQYRKQHVMRLLHSTQAAIIGLQEVLAHQLQDLKAALPDYACVAVGRDDGQDAGEHAPIFYHKRFQLLKQGTLWLSETPDIPSRGWDASLPRIATWIALQDDQTKTVFYHVNTHFDHLGQLAQRRSAELLVQQITHLADTSPTILTGDLNVEPGDQPYTLLSNVLEDAFEVAQARSGGESTFVGFEVAKGKGKRIDYVLTRGFLVERYETLADHADGYYFSDHLPVLVELRIA